MPTISMAVFTFSFLSIRMRTKSTCSIARDTGSTERSRIITWPAPSAPFSFSWKIAFSWIPLRRRLRSDFLGIASGTVSVPRPPP